MLGMGLRTNLENVHRRGHIAMRARYTEIVSFAKGTSIIFNYHVEVHTHIHV